MDPFYGFNEWSTQVRVGPDDQPSFYQFESPLLRLHTDEDQILVEGDQEAYLDGHDDIPSNTLWVHRFYEVSASTWGGNPEEFRLENAAADLLRLVEKTPGRSKPHWSTISSLRETASAGRPRCGCRCAACRS